MSGYLRAYAPADARLPWEIDTARDYVTENGVSERGGAMEGPGPIIARAARTDSSCSEGRVNWNTAPRGSFAVTHSRPPCVSMIDRQLSPLGD